MKALMHIKVEISHCLNSNTLVMRKKKKFKKLNFLKIVPFHMVKNKFQVSDHGENFTL